jgi:hypothetical protein
MSSDNNTKTSVVNDGKTIKRNKGGLFAKGTPKTGGRAKGTPNKSTLKFREVLEAKGFSVPEELMNLFLNSNDDGIRLRCLELMAQYSYPKFREVDPEGSSDQKIEITYNRVD